MKNREKYRDEILNYNNDCDICEKFIKPIILRALGKECGDICCTQCRLLQMLWLEEEYKEPEVDWSKVAVDTPVLVSKDGKIWHNRHFAGYANGGVYVWNNGCTSWTKEGEISVWKYVKLAEVKS